MVAVTTGRTRVRITLPATLTLMTLFLPLVRRMISRIEKSSKFFYLFAEKVLTNAARCGIIEVGIFGPETKVRARFSDRYTICEIFAQSSGICLKTCQSRNSHLAPTAYVLYFIYLGPVGAKILLHHIYYNIFFYKNQLKILSHALPTGI